MRSTALGDGPLAHCGKETLEYGGHGGRRWGVVAVAIQSGGGFKGDKRCGPNKDNLRSGFVASAWQKHRATAVIDHVTLIEIGARS